MNELVAALLFRKVGGKGGYPEPTGSIDITKNGVTDVKNYAEANVNVPNSYAASDEGKVVDNGTLVSQTAKNIVENGTHDTAKNNSVVVNVPNSYAAGDEGKVVQSGALVAQTQKSVNANGTYDTTANNSVVVDVPTSGGSSILFATDATYSDEPIQGNTCSAEVLSADLRLYSADDIVVLYGEEQPNTTGKSYLVAGKICYISLPSEVSFIVEGVSEISGGSSGKSGFAVLNNVTGDGDLGDGGLITIFPNSQEDLNGVNVGDSLLAKGSFAGGYHVVFGKVTEKYDNSVTASVIKALSSDNDGSTWTLDCSADSEPSDGEYITVILADSSSAGNLNQNDYLIGRLTVDGVDYAFYSQVDYVVDSGKGEVSVIGLAHIAIPFS